MKAEYSDVNSSSWDERSIKYKNNIKSVLFRRFPDVLNNHIHNFHNIYILDHLPPETNGTVLDAGCGYGRNSLPPIKRNENMRIMGFDISQTFVDLYKSNTGKQAYVGTLEDFPKEISKVDCILCVTVLMYVEKEKTGLAIENMRDHLNKNGEIILIEPLISGYLFSSGFGLLNLFFKKQDIKNGRCFTAKELRNYIRSKNGSCMNEIRMPFTTVFILPLFMLSLLVGNKLMERIMKITSKFDQLLGNLNLPSLYVAMVVRFD